MNVAAATAATTTMTASCTRRPGHRDRLTGKWTFITQSRYRRFMPEWNDIGRGAACRGTMRRPIGRIIATGSRTLVSMTLHLHDSAAREVRPFQTVHPGRVSLYVRGTTAPGRPDMGQLRLAVCVDIVIRWLEASGQRVTYCRNVTDLDKAVRVAAES